PEEVPAPVAALRLSDGTWFGGSRLFGATPIEGYEAELVASGPVFAEVALRYRYAGGKTFRLRVQLAARQQEARWSARVDDTLKDNGWALDVSRGAPALTPLIQRKSHGVHPKLRSKDVEKAGWLAVPLDEFETGKVVQKLTPFADHWWGNTTHRMRLQLGEGPRELRIRRWDVGAWVEPKPLGTLVGWEQFLPLQVPLVRAAEGLELRFDHVRGRRKWRLGEFGPMETDTWRSRWVGRGGGQVLTEQPELNEVKDYVLDWEGADQTPRPTVLFGPDVYTEAVKRTRSYAFNQHHLKRLENGLAAFGEFDKFRTTALVISLYEGVMATDLPSEAQRRLFRAQLAYLAYRHMHPSTWSIERGYRTYNFNMSVVHGTVPGLFAAALPNHPEAEAWARLSLERVRLWLDQKVNATGEWPESLHYIHLSTTMFLHLAIAARRAGFADLFEETALNQLGTYLAQQYTPPDPLYDRRSVSPPIGRGAGGSYGLFGAWAHATRESHPQLSRHMQWAWLQTGQSDQFNQMSPLARLVLNPELPAEAPDWSSTRYPRYGYILRNGVGSEQQHYLNFIADSNRNADIWSPETGQVARWYAFGDPIGGAFRDGYYGKHELLRNGVAPARNWQPGDSLAPYGHHTRCMKRIEALLPRQDYLDLQYEFRRPSPRSWFPQDLPPWPEVPNEAGELPIAWRRQVLFIKGQEASSPHYLVLRDTVETDQPTMWQFWTLSEKLGESEAARDTETFLADAPGHEAVPPRALTGDRFTAVGQFETDLEYFVVEPKDTPRHTLRWSDNSFLYDIGRPKESQDLLHLQREGEGAYHVVLFPRQRDTEAPRFTELADGRIVKIAGAFGTDYVFLHEASTDAETSEVRFHGTVGSVQDRTDGLTLTLGAEGEVRYGAYGLKSEALAVDMTVRDHSSTISVTGHDDVGDTANLWLPGEWEPAKHHDGVTFRPQGDGRYELDFEQGATSVQLQRTDRGTD
ncbi:MAG: hypothetical protein ACOC9P_01390, partial [bacterium]